jgi:hypothetical protein
MVTIFPPLRVITSVRCARQQGYQCMLGGRAEPGCDQQGAEFVAVQADGVGFVVEPRPSDVRCRGVIEQFFFDGVLVEPGDRAQPPSNGGPRPAVGFQVASEAIDVGAPGLEQPELVLLAPAGVLAQVPSVSLAGQAGVPAKNPASASRSALANTGSATAITVDGDNVVAVIGHLPDLAKTRKAGPAPGPSDDDSPHRESTWLITQGHGGSLDHCPGSPITRSVVMTQAGCSGGADRPVMACRSRRGWRCRIG